jgi:hypothetical protein
MGGSFSNPSAPANFSTLNNDGIGSLGCFFIPIALPVRPARLRCFQPKTKYPLKEETVNGSESRSDATDARENRGTIRHETAREEGPELGPKS